MRCLMTLPSLFVAIVVSLLVALMSQVRAKAETGPGEGWHICSGHLECQDIV